MNIAKADPKINISGAIEAEIRSTVQNTTGNEGVQFNTSGRDDTYQRFSTEFAESDLEIKASSEYGTWKLSSEIELELKRENEFSIEEASINADNDTIKLSFGILEDEVDLFKGEASSPITANVLETNLLSDGTPAIRVAYIGYQGVSIDGKLRAFHDEGDGLFIPRTNNTQIRFQLQAELPFGELALVSDSFTSSVEDKNEFKGARDYTLEGTLYYILLKTNFDNITPFINYGTQTISIAIHDVIDEMDITETGTLLGLDYNISERSIVTAFYNFRTQIVEEVDDIYSLTDLAIGYRRNYGNLVTIISYVVSSNNQAEVVDGATNQTFSGVESSISYHF